MTIEEEVGMVIDGVEIITGTKIGKIGVEAEAEVDIIDGEVKTADEGAVKIGLEAETTVVEARITIEVDHRALAGKQGTFHQCFHESNQVRCQTICAA